MRRPMCSRSGECFVGVSRFYRERGTNIMPTKWRQSFGEAMASEVLIVASRGEGRTAQAAEGEYVA